LYLFYSEYWDWNTNSCKWCFSAGEPEASVSVLARWWPLLHQRLPRRAVPRGQRSTLAFLNQSSHTHTSADSVFFFSSRVKFLWELNLATITRWEPFRPLPAGRVCVCVCVCRSLRLFVCSAVWSVCVCWSSAGVCDRPHAVW